MIGNSQYTTGPLRNPVNDAEIWQTCCKVGFSVTLLKDGDQPQIETPSP